MLKKSVTALVVCFLFVTVPLSAFAMNDEVSMEKSEHIIVEPLWNEIAEFSNGFDISTTGKATIESILYAFDVDEIRIDANLQQYKNGSWTTIKSWSSTSRDIYCAIDEIWYVISGYSYRLVSTGRVYENGKQVEQATYTSGPIRY